MQDAYDCVQKSLRIIYRFLLFVRAKINRRNRKNLCRISISKTYSLRPYSITFFHSSSTQTYQMIYSLLHKEYYIEVWLPQSSNFLVKSQSTEILLESFPTRQTDTGRLMNYVQLPIKIPKFLFIEPQKINKELVFNSFGRSIGKVEDRNEDAYFTSPFAIGIADGVGDLMNEFGISSKEFSTELMQTCKELMISLNSKAHGKEIVKNALTQMDSGGSSTYLLASLKRNKLMISNMGDCRVLIFRKSNNSVKLMFQTPAKQHSFNVPYQVSKEFSPTQLSRKLTTESKNIMKSNCQIDSDDYIITVHEGDLLIFGSDGLFDNMFTKDILKVVKKNYFQGNLSCIGNLLIQQAKKNSQSGMTTPFEENMKNNKCHWKGGKNDDITVIVSLLQSAIHSS